MNYDNEIRNLSESLGLKLFSNYAQHISNDASFEEKLYSLLYYEHAEKEQRNFGRKTREAGFPVVKTLNTFDFTWLKHVSKSEIDVLATCDFVSDHNNCAMIGNPGTGKSHICISIGIEAIKKKYSVKYYRASDLARILKEAEIKNVLTPLMKKLNKVDLLLLDEFGYIEIDKPGVNNLFAVFASRYECKSTIITSNFQFSEWDKFLGDKTLANALIDRLAHKTVLLDMRGQSYRLNEGKNELLKKNKKQTQSKDSPVAGSICEEKK